MPQKWLLLVTHLGPSPLDELRIDQVANGQKALLLHWDLESTKLQDIYWGPVVSSPTPFEVLTSESDPPGFEQIPPA